VGDLFPHIRKISRRNLQYPAIHGGDALLQTIKEKLLEAVDSEEEICTTVITIYEILKGFIWRNNKRKERPFKEFLEDVVIFTIDDDVINIASDLYTNLRKKGKTIGDADVFIAAIVIKNNIIQNIMKMLNN
jgi:tRNA(fMet)-specific endonuclease VapC